MSYVQRVLQPGEVVRYTASLHWILYLPGILACVLAAVIALVRPDGSLHPFGNLVVVILAWLCFGAGLVLIAHAWFGWWITEIAVTDRRVISKTGFISRRTTEVNMDKVASVDVTQSILGRLLDYGDVVVHSTGMEMEPLKLIARPLELRNHITAV
jgi:uncharacterized membrane protein YdbT with pleckstrin-like domain